MQLLHSLRQGPESLSFVLQLLWVVSFPVPKTGKRVAVTMQWRLSCTIFKMAWERSFFIIGFVVLAVVCQAGARRSQSARALLTVGAAGGLHRAAGILSYMKMQWSCLCLHLSRFLKLWWCSSLHYRCSLHLCTPGGHQSLENVHVLLFLVWLGLADFRRTSTYMCGSRAGLENIMAKLMGLHGSSECMSLRTCVRQAFNFEDITAITPP